MRFTALMFPSLRFASFFLLMAGLLAIPARSQQSVQVAPQAGGRAHPAHRVMAPPKAATVQGTAARSTAQGMAAHTSEPLARLPSFAVTGLDKKVVDIGSFHNSGHWLMLYRAEHCLPCDKVMGALAKSENPLFKQGASYVIVVKKSGGGAASGMLDQIKASYPTLANATWVEDVGGVGFAALQPHGQPVLYAVNDSDIAWAIHGTLGNPATLEKLAGTWLASTSVPHPAVAAGRSAKPARAGAATNSRKAAALPIH